MNCLSLNLGSICASEKREWVLNLCDVHKVIFLGIQETRMA